MAVRMAHGAIENAVVPLVDNTGLVSELAATNPRFDVVEEDGITPVVTNQAASASGMTIFCLLNTTTWADDHYYLYVYFTSGSEVPRLGPFDIYLT